MKTSDCELFKQRTTRYYDASGKRMSAETPGARKEVVESKKWHARVKDFATGKWNLVGMSCVFVPQDLSYMGLGMEELHALNPRLAPLIAHDRAGFGGAVCCGASAAAFSIGGFSEPYYSLHLAANPAAVVAARVADPSYRGGLV